MDKRVVIYVDGLNFYSGLRAAEWKKYYWLDLVSFFSKFLRASQVLQGINYFSCIPSERDRENRQAQFFLANKLDPRFKLHLGALHKMKVSCDKCHSVSTIYVEKESDVRLASKMISDVVTEGCDLSILVSGDRDFLPTIETIRELKPDHKIFTFFPPQRTSLYLKKVSNYYIDLGKHEQKFTTSLLPFTIPNPTTGHLIQRPQKWL